MPTHRRLVLLVVALSWAASACTTGIRPTDASPSKATRVADPLEAWLRGHPEHRALNDEDCACPADLKEARSTAGPGGGVNRAYKPFRAVGDFNKDGKEDLAVGVATTQDKAHFRVLIFNNHKASLATDRPYLSPPLNRGVAIFFGPPAGGEHLLVGPFESEASAFIPDRRNGYRIDSTL